MSYPFMSVRSGPSFHEIAVSTESAITVTRGVAAGCLAVAVDDIAAVASRATRRVGQAPGENPLLGMPYPFPYCTSISMMCRLAVEDKGYGVTTMSPLMSGPWISQK
jgi:hypothetical protein